MPRLSIGQEKAMSEGFTYSGYPPEKNIDKVKEWEQIERAHGHDARVVRSVQDGWFIYIKQKQYRDD